MQEMTDLITCANEEIGLSVRIVLTVVLNALHMQQSALQSARKIGQ